MRVTDEQRESLRENGYAVFRQVIDPAVAQRAAAEIVRFVGADLADPSTWYRGDRRLDGIAPLHHADGLWEVRQQPGVYEVFRRLWGADNLYVDMNRCCFRPPASPQHPGRSLGEIHWDIDPRGPLPPSLQGIALLSDVGRNGGGYQCVPSIYRKVDEWLAQNAHAPDFDFFNPGIDFGDAVQVQGCAGDLIVWSTRLPHGPAPNFSRTPRIAAFVSMGVANQDPELRAERVSWWRDKRAPPWWRGLPGQLDPEPGPPARLTALGRKLVGVEPWG